MSWFLTVQPKIKTEIKKLDPTVEKTSIDDISSPDSESLCQAETLKYKYSLNFNQTASSVIGPETVPQRRRQAYKLRQEAALFEKDLPLPGHPCNGDEFLYPHKIGNYSKALPHNQLGQVNIHAYQAMIKALTTGNPEMFSEIPLGGVAKLANPQSAYAFDLTGPDCNHLGIIPPPTFSSAKNAGEMLELYWQALTRDIPFSEYATNTLTLQAAAELKGFSGFNPTNLFRLDVPGALEGPYISQFLYKNIPFGAASIPQRYRIPVADNNFMTDYAKWLNIQNGLLPTDQISYNNTPRYILNGRDLGEYVHRDFSFQAPLTACLILLSLGQDALASNNPYLFSPTQAGFITFGSPHFLDFTTKAVRVALEAAWFQKFLVHRRLRPEEFGGSVHNTLTRAIVYPIDPDLLISQAVSQVFSEYGTYLLPQAYPEGCPTHPAYPAGHAAIVGASITILKAFFKESFILPNPVIPSADGLALLPYSGPPLTVGGELNKLAANICMGRDFAGIHWRSDGTEGMKLGEDVAIGILQDYRNTYNEDFMEFSFTKFDGTAITI